MIIPVKNEEKNLPACLEALGDDWDEIFVVDSGSSDKTIEIAKKHGASIINFVWDGRFPKKRNWFLDHGGIKNDWCLFLDADEIVNYQFQKEVVEAIQSQEHNGYWLNYTNYFMDRPLYHGVRQRKLALFRRSMGRYERIDEDYWTGLDMEVHEHPQLTGSIGHIITRIDHRSFQGLNKFLESHLEYAKWEAARYLKLNDSPDLIELTRRQKIKYYFINKTWFAFIYFFFNYFIKLGFMDGFAGLQYSIFKGWYFLTISLMISEERNKQRKDDTVVFRN